MTDISPRRWWAMGALSVAVLAISLDITVLTVALPTLAGVFKASESQLQWFITAYTLVLAAAMLPSGLLGDRYGHRAVTLVALVVFGLGSIAGAYAPGPEAFIVARAVLGLAGAALIVMALSLITILFDETERPRAVGIWGAATFVALPLGPILGGWILTNAWWGWVFLLNVPVVMAALVAVFAFVPSTRAPVRPRIDVFGVVASSGGLALLMYGIIEAGRNEWSDLGAVGPAVAGLAVLVTFVLWEARLTRQPDGHPLVDLGLFRSRSFGWGVILTSIGVFGLSGLLFTLPQFFQAIVGTDAQGSGFRLLPGIAGLILGALPADRIAARIGAKLTVAAGFAVLAIGLAIGSTMTTTSGDAFVAGWNVLVGFGAGLSFATSASAALVELSAERSGVGAGLIQAITKLGPAFGATILGSVLSATYQGRLDLAGLPAEAAAIVAKSVFGGLSVAQQAGSSALADSVRTAFVAGMDDALRVTAAIALGGVVLALAFLPAGSKRATLVEAEHGGVEREFVARG
ncbi:MAG: DHA2 family efflux MFS transporter permease subunit [Chloroflexi bacterium]|nr:DHA2 family efflux MFS transporter permease subunit [Chloroflexota bacterium]